MINPFVVLIEVIRALDALQIDYVVVGSIASSIHGEYRASGDVDIIARIESRHISSLVESLKNDFYVDDQMIRRAVERGGSFNVIHLTAIFKVDIFITASVLAEQQLKRREQHELGSIADQQIWVATAEDTILAKLYWYRLGDEVSELQWRDVRGIIETRRGMLDLDYLDDWASRLELHDLLQRALAESV